MGFWSCSDPFFLVVARQSASASPPSRGQKRRTKRKRKAEQHSDLGPNNGVYVAISWTFTQLFVAFGIFWILGEAHFLKRTFWMDHPGDYQHVNLQSWDLMIPMLNDITGSVARGTWGWFEAMKHCPGADQEFHPRVEVMTNFLKLAILGCWEERPEQVPSRRHLHLRKIQKKRPL